MKLQPKQPTARIIKAPELTHILTESDVNYPKFNNTDRIVIRARLNGNAICDIDKKELSVLADVAIFKISAISGFTLSSSEKFADILNDEFLLMLEEYGFSELTFEEIVTAFRINAQGSYRTNGGHTVETVMPYSTFFSITYAANVLKNYLTIRRCGEYKFVEVSIQEQTKKYE